jgi:hypothetical protein
MGRRYRVLLVSSSGRLQARGYAVTGVEQSPGMIAALRDHPPGPASRWSSRR